MYLTLPPPILIFFFFNDTATTEIYTLSLHDALPISIVAPVALLGTFAVMLVAGFSINVLTDRKSTRLNSSHLVISYAVFCLKKKKKNYWFCGIKSVKKYLRILYKRCAID